MTEMTFKFAHNNFNVLDLDKSLKFYFKPLVKSAVLEKILVFFWCLFSVF